MSTLPRILEFNRLNGRTASVAAFFVDRFLSA
jgi:hypothetical protein